MTDKAVAPVNTAMLDRAEKSDGGNESVMNTIHSFKLYNPRIGEPVDPTKANKFRLVEANSGTEVFDDFGGSVVFNPLDVSYFYSGSIYPILEGGAYAEDKVFFFTNEFGKFAKKTDTIGIAANGKALGFFTKGEFEEMIRTPNLNGSENQFFEKKKDKDGKPYNGSQLKKGAVIYGQFIGGKYDQEYFRMFTSLSNIGLTFKDGAACEADEGTFEYAVSQGLAALNEVLAANGRKPVGRISPDQCDIRISIRENEKHNFLPVFEFHGLVAVRGEDNTEAQKYIYDLKNTHFASIFDHMLEPTPIMIANGAATMKIAQPQLKASNRPDPNTPTQTGLQVEDAEEVFDAPGTADHAAHEKQLDF